EPDDGRVHLGGRVERAGWNAEEFLDRGAGLDTYTQGPVRLAPRPGDDPPGDLLLHQEDNAFGAGWRERAIEQRGRDVVRNIAGHQQIVARAEAGRLAPVELEGVSFD